MLDETWAAHQWDKEGLTQLVENLRLQLKDQQIIYIELKWKHNEKVDEIEERKLQELLEEKERHTREKKTLEHDLTLLHRNLDVESRFSKELALENHRLQDWHEKFWNQVDIEKIKT